MQNPDHLILFFGQLRTFLTQPDIPNNYTGEFYLLSPKERKPCTDEMVAHLEMESGFWDEACVRVEGRVVFSGQDIDYRDMTFAFSNFGNRFDTCLNDLVGESALPFVPSALRIRRFKNPEFIIQAISKCVNSAAFPAVLPGHDNPDLRRKELDRLEQDCIALGFALVIDPEQDPLADARLIRRYNELVLSKACQAMSDREIKQIGQRFRIDAKKYFALANGPENLGLPNETSQAIFGLNAKMQALGFLISVDLNPSFAGLFYAMISNRVLIGEAATYLRNGRLEADLNWGGDFGYQYAPHQRFLINGKDPVVFDAMRVGYCCAASFLVQESRFPFGNYAAYRSMFGDADTIPDAIIHLFEQVLLPPAQD